MPRFPVLMLLVFALTLFTSATLLFFVEPMIGKMILPLLGGTPAVWNTCMVFFQAVLLLGYLYAHLSTSWLGPRKQAVLHMALLLLPLIFLPIAVNRGIIKGDENPIFIVLGVLSLSVGVPMFVVCASAPLLQKWFASTSHPAAKDPYFLYGASNFGSLLALIAYPALIEPKLRLGQQSFDWLIGYGVLAALTALCAVFLWRSPRNLEVAEKMEDTIRPSPPSTADSLSHPLAGEVTWQRVLRWLALAFVPSSLMLGATTYITTDIASIPLFWVAPLALYLLSFILVFSKPWFQQLFLAVAGVLLAAVLGYFFWDLGMVSSRRMIRLGARVLIFVAAGGGIGAVWMSWKSRDSNMLHRVMVLLLPLVVLTLLFFMLSGAHAKTHWITWTLAMHLTALFVVSMVCHGELARDRPPVRHLTGYFLWMSVGGVLGGLFNALLAPLIFKGIVEYELAMVLACYLTPPLAMGRQSSWGRPVDVLLAGLFGGVGILLIRLRLNDGILSRDSLSSGPWRTVLAALLAGLAVGILLAIRGQGKPFDRFMDVLTPVCLGVLLVGLRWGVESSALHDRLETIADSFGKDADELYPFLTFGTAAVMCYTLVERSLRFALGVGALLLGTSFCGLLDDRVLHQERSFFGVLKVQRGRLIYEGEVKPTRSLIHGTTWHGMQVLDDQLRDTPLTYYHPSGPIGEVMLEYNNPADDRHRGGMRPVAVIGLGTGTMACFARPGQHMTFYDIDPVVRRLSFEDDDPYFTFVHDAKERGASIDLVMGDARLTLERKQLKASEKYGIMLMDAFSSDAIPVHLITLEALDIYLDKLAEDGLLIFHISNRHLDLRPVLYNLAKERNLAAAFQSDGREDPIYPGKTGSSVVVLARHQKYLHQLYELNDWEDERKELQQSLFRVGALPIGDGMGTQALLLVRYLEQEFCKRAEVQWEELKPDEGKDSEWRKVGVWTDDYSNLLSVFLW